MISSLVLSSSKAAQQESRTHGSCRTNWPRLLEDVPLIDEVVRTANTTDFLICHVKSRSARSFPRAMVWRGNAHRWPSRSAALAHWISVCVGTDKKKFEERDALLRGTLGEADQTTVGCSWGEQRALFTTERPDMLRLGRWWNFRKPVCSKGQYESKAISYKVTLNLNFYCISYCAGFIILFHLFSIFLPPYSRFLRPKTDKHPEYHLLQ